jgi:F-box and leucine-rich repeat protein 10/11
MHTRHSLPNQLSVGSSLLQDIAFSAQQALDQSVEDEFVPVDPALQAYATGAYPTLSTNGDGIMSSIEENGNGDYLMESIEFAKHPSIEPLTPGSPPPQFNPPHTGTNGYMDISDTRPEPVRHPGSPLTGDQLSEIDPSLGQDTFHGQYKPATGIGPQPPTTPGNNNRRGSRPPNSGGNKAGRQVPRASKTPKSSSSSRRADGQDCIKMETGLGFGLNGAGMLGMDMIDPSLDQASIELIKQLQQEEHGLRRRSRWKLFRTAGSFWHVQSLAISMCWGSWMVMVYAVHIFCRLTLSLSLAFFVCLVNTHTLW